MTRKQTLVTGVWLMSALLACQPKSPAGVTKAQAAAIIPYTLVEPWSLEKAVRTNDRNGPREITVVSCSREPALKPSFGIKRFIDAHASPQEFLSGTTWSSRDAMTVNRYSQFDVDGDGISDDVRCVQSGKLWFVIVIRNR